MPTTKPRITITLEPKVYEVLRRLSEAGGDSMSAVVTDFLDVAVPSMERMVVVLEQANAIPQETKEGLRGSMLRAEARVLPAIAEALDQTDLFITEVAKLAADGRGAGAASQRPETAQKGLSTPVPVTRGSGRQKRTKIGSRHGRL